MANVWKKYLIFIAISLLVMPLIYLASGPAVFEVMVWIIVCAIWPFFGGYSLAIYRKEKQNEIVGE